MLAAVTFTENYLTDSSINNQLLAAVTYKQVASEVKHCNRKGLPRSSDARVGSFGGSTNDINRNGSVHGKGKCYFGFKKPSLSVLRRKSCLQCRNFGH